ncbi:3',5'-cyclic-nucleotide phosphodiesterase [Theileria orientalis]|uniref:Phosphodiesterase n=1 Tax=Theileria orientalis TaxID=68886 RepID=A0A976M5G3_THEOR|nr:3',5'-cyclic-nucleotide phosphodiesterase [Theileria orientalis]
MVNYKDAARPDKESVNNSVAVVENYLRHSGAPEELLQTFEMLKAAIANPDHGSLDKFPSFNSFISRASLPDLTNGLDRDLKTAEYSLLDYAASNHSLPNSNTLPADQKGWTVGTSRRSSRIDREKIEDYLLQLGKNLNLDLLELSNVPQVVEQGPIVSFGRVLLKDAGDKIHSTFNTLLVPVLKDIQDMYMPNPYHNALHGASVAHMSSILAKAVAGVRKFNPYEEFAFILASLGHDVGHPGKTNSFVIATENPLSLIYNDISVLENYHCSLIFHIIRYHSRFSSLIPKGEWEVIRKRVIQLVLATDMKSHFAHVNNVKNRRENKEFDIVKNEEDLWLLLVLCVKAADIGHNFLPWPDHLTWSLVLFKEFYIQGDEEKALSMTPFMLYDRDKAKDIPGSQLVFYNTFTGPLLTELKNFDSTGYINNVVMRNANYNIQCWTKHKDKPVDEIVKEIDDSKEQFDIEDAFVCVE